MVRCNGEAHDRCKYDELLSTATENVHDVCEAAVDVGFALLASTLRVTIFILPVENKEQSPFVTVLDVRRSYS